MANTSYDMLFAWAQHFIMRRTGQSEVSVEKGNDSREMVLRVKKFNSDQNLELARQEFEFNIKEFATVSVNISTPAGTFTPAPQWSEKAATNASEATFTISGDIKGANDHFPQGPYIYNETGESKSHQKFRQ